ncbi:tetratricopeptide repeat protein [Aquimarina celericrescens]|uniref:Tol-pal system YbgF family protein n=1 Tax=Aquimarina celericrescens TaxID=1964542 RepID=A0ABW5B265_9FLAO|nr:hypothetical protein [Aquimarina celericrescens]
MKEQMYQKIEAYVGNSMTPEEQRQFEIEIAQNPELQKEVRLFNEINHHLNQKTWLPVDEIHAKAKRKELKEFINSDEAEALKLKLKRAAENYKKNKNKVKIRYIIGSTAAILVVGLISAIFWKGTPNHNLLYEEYYTQSDLPSVVKRGAEDDLLTQGITAFKAKDFKASAKNFEEYMTESLNKDPLIYAYIGFSYLEMEKTKSALINFDKLLTSNSIDNSRALWYKSLAYLKANKIEESKEVLIKIIQDSLNFNYKKAKELWIDIK